MREIASQKKSPTRPWLWAPATIGACLAIFVVYDLTSSASDDDALAAANAKSSSRERELRLQVDQLKKGLGESEGRLAAANLKIQELVVERERRRAAEDARINQPGSAVSAADLKIAAAAPSTRTRRNDLLIADAVRDFYNGRVHAAKFKLEEIVMNDPTDIVACEVLVIVLRGVMDAEVAKRTAERSAGGR